MRTASLSDLEGLLHVRWGPLARREVASLLRSKGVWLLSIVLIVDTYRRMSPSEYIRRELEANVTIAAFQSPMALFVSLGALLVAYRAIAGERESGSIAFTVGMPLTRWEVLVGKILGRTAALAFPVVLAFCVGGAIGFVRYGAFSPVAFSLTVLVTFLYAVANVSVATGISALVKTPARSATAIVGYFLVFLWLWNTGLSRRLYLEATGVPIDFLNPPPAVGLFLLERIGPAGAYYVLTNTILGVGNAAATYSEVLGYYRPETLYFTLIVGETFKPPIPFLLRPSFAVVILALWIAVPASLGYLRFRNADLS